jgi:acetoin utilization protein AcuB
MRIIEYLNSRVSDYMTKEVRTVGRDSLLTEVKEVFDKNLFHHIPVVDEIGNIQGIISKSDLLLMMDWGVKLHIKGSEARNQNLLNSTLASEVMTENVMKVKESDTLQYCLDIFLENFFRALPVVDDQGKLVGLITVYDILVGLEQSRK